MVFGVHSPVAVCPRATMSYKTADESERPAPSYEVFSLNASEGALTTYFSGVIEHACDLRGVVYYAVTRVSKNHAVHMLRPQSLLRALGISPATRFESHPAKEFLL